MKDIGVSSVVGNILMIFITLILTIAVLMIGLYYAGILGHEAFIGEIIPNNSNSSDNYLNATFIYNSPSNYKLNAYDLMGFLLYNNSRASIVFLVSQNISGYYFIANFTTLKISILLNIENPNGMIVNSTNPTIDDNSIFHFFSKYPIDFGDIQLQISFKGTSGSLTAQL